MDRGMVIFLGVLLTFTSSWLGLVLLPLLPENSRIPFLSQMRIQNQEPFIEDKGGASSSYPQPLGGAALNGRRVYQKNGCIYCHSQQIRAESFGNNSDIKRGWATRRTVPRDYAYDQPIMLGTMRTGPDLANIGAGPGKDCRWYAADWHHKHLYNPRMMTPGSIMPPFRFLYEKRKIVGEPAADALAFTGDWAGELEPGFEVVPTDEAKDLVAYLLSLDRTSVALPEAKE
jgi:cytochrome c oxidase cbb3-type subunit II